MKRLHRDVYKSQAHEWLVSAEESIVYLMVMWEEQYVQQVTECCGFPEIQ